MKEIFFATFFDAVDDILETQVRDAWPDSWDENHVTFSLVQALGRLGRLEVTGFDRPFKVTWKAHKLRRPAETRYGDLAIIVKLITWRPQTIEGVALLEAKRRDREGTTFSAAKESQLTTILKSAPHAQLLLYDHEGTTGCMDNVFAALEDVKLRGRYRRLGHTHATCVPMNTAMTQPGFDTALHTLGVPLSYQLICRYLRGFDLEEDDDALATAKGNAQKHAGPEYVVLVGVSTHPTQLPELPAGLNTNIYEEVP